MSSARAPEIVLVWVYPDGGPDPVVLGYSGPVMGKAADDWSADDWSFLFDDYGPAHNDEDAVCHFPEPGMWRWVGDCDHLGHQMQDGDYSDPDIRGEWERCDALTMSMAMLLETPSDE